MVLATVVVLFVCFISFCAIANVFDSAMWSDLQEAAGEWHELRALADTLPDVLLYGRAHSTVVKYSGGFRRWKDWAQSHHLPAMPFSPFHVVLYLRSL